MISSPDFLPQELLRSKAIGGSWSAEEIQFLVQGIADGSLADSQVGAFAMAVFLKGLVPEEIARLTLAMRDSGNVLTWDLPGPAIDKHSTGGVGDLVSLVMGPMIAACGGYVPMISGRGLGHTGGTLDKLDSIPGYNTSLSIEEFRRVVRETGVSIIGQTADLAPADKRLYAIRDVTGTVASIPLITASILSKKLASGLNALVMDVKTGNGAFMESYEGSVALARSISDVCGIAGVPVASIVTDMNQPLASSAGNALEVLYACEYLSGIKRESRFHSITMELSSELLVLAGIHKDKTASKIYLQEVLDSGKAWEVFGKMVHAHGGRSDFVERYSRILDISMDLHPIESPISGRIIGISTRDLGLLVVELGGGRRTPTDPIDYRVGLSKIRELGAIVSSGEPLGYVHAKSREEASRIAEKARNCFRITEDLDGYKEPKLVLDRFVRN